MLDCYFFACESAGKITLRHFGNLSEEESQRDIIWDKTIEMSGPDNGIVATGDLSAIMSDGKEGILSFHDKRLDDLS